MSFVVGAAAPPASSQGVARMQSLELTVHRLAERVASLEEEVSRLTNKNVEEVEAPGAEDWLAASLGFKDLKVSVRKNLEDSSDDDDSNNSETTRHTTNLLTVFGGLSYPIQPSAWDSILFVGQGLFGLGGFISLMFGLLINLVLQFTLVWVFVHSGSFWELGDLSTAADNFMRWRLHYGHSVTNADPITRTSLVSRVCSEDEALYMSTQQASSYYNISEYQSQHGQLLAICCLGLLTLAVSAELRSVSYFIVSVWCIPTGKSTRMRIEDGKASFACISYHRLFMASFIAAVRTAIALIILFVGSRWLVKESNVESLILNAVALAFILDIDEMVYELCSPCMLDKMLDEMDPLPFSDEVTGMFQHWLRPVKVFFLCCALVFFSNDLAKLSAANIEIKETLCGGNKDFVFGFDPTGRLWYSPTPPFNDDPSSGIDMVQEEIITDIAFKLNFSVGKGLWPRAEQIFLNDLPFRTDGNIRDIAKASESCQNNEHEFRTLRSLSSGNNSIESCADAKQYCENEASVGLRLRCPETCGCDSPTSGLVRRLNSDGCPRTACQRLPSYVSELQKLPCKDWSLERLAGHEGWKKLFFGYKKMLLDYQQTSLSQEQDAAWSEQKLAELDCSSMMSFLGNQSRTFGGGRRLKYVCRRGLVAFCPETCWCTDRQEQSEWLIKAEEAAKDIFNNECPKTCLVQR